MTIISKNGSSSHVNFTDAERSNAMNVSVVNDSCESTFGVSNDKIPRHANTVFFREGDISMARRIMNLLLDAKRYQNMVSVIMHNLYCVP